MHNNKQSVLTTEWWRKKQKRCNGNHFSWSLFVILIQRYPLTIFNGNLKCAYFQWVDMGLFNRIRPRSRFCESGPIRSRFGESDPIRSDPIRSWFCQRPKLGKFMELYIFHQGLAARFFSVMTFPMVPTFQLRWFGWNRPPHFFKNTLWNWSVFACLIKLCNGGVVKVSPLAGFKLNGHKSRFSE